MRCVAAEKVLLLLRRNLRGLKLLLRKLDGKSKRKRRHLRRKR